VQNGPDFGTAVIAMPNVISVITTRDIEEKKPIFFPLIFSSYSVFMFLVFKAHEYYKNKTVKIKKKQQDSK